MRAAGFGFLVVCIIALTGSALAQRAQPLPSRVGTAAMPSAAALEAHLAAVASTADAARSMQQAIDIERARQVAPFDLAWGTP